MNQETNRLMPPRTLTRCLEILPTINLRVCLRSTLQNYAANCELMLEQIAKDMQRAIRMRVGFGLTNEQITILVALRDGTSGYAQETLTDFISYFKNGEEVA